MKKLLSLLSLAVLLSGCVSYRGGTFGPDLPSNNMDFGRGTTGVGSGDDPGPGITGSDAVPRNW